MERRALALKRETLTELTRDDLAAVVGGTTAAGQSLLALLARLGDASTPTVDDTCV